jgi:hypothetical protein
MPVSDLEDVVTSAVEDAELPEEVETPDSDTPDDAPVEAPTASEGTKDDESDVEVPSPAKGASDAKPEAQDEFEKKFGIPAQSVMGRENRIPYSRVKKIVEKGEKEAVAKTTKEVEAKYVPQLEQAQTKIKEYETQLTQAAQFREVLTTDAPRTLQYLASLPAYKEFFENVANLIQAQKGQPQAPTAPDPADEMPQPDQKQSDGTMLYSMEGLAKLRAWEKAQIQKELTTTYDKRFEELQNRYKPIEEQWQAERYRQEVMPQVQKQIDEARTWPLFKENEAEIVQVLSADQKISLERAYQQVVWPKIIQNQDQIRASVMEEMKKKPVGSTSTPTRANKPAPVGASTGPVDLESIIKGAVDEAGIR